MEVRSEAGGHGHRRLQGSHRRPDREAGDLPEAPRRRARDDLRGVRRARGRRRDRDRPAVRAPVHAARPGQGGGAPAAGRAGALRALPQRRAAEGLHRRGPPGREGAADRGLTIHPGLLRTLFELEVPEIADGIVEIRAVAREPGHRSKIAVCSNEPAVDPVGACVGPKGSRVRMVVNELRGEKIDVVPWSDDTREFVANALQPAKVKEVSDRSGHADGAGDRARLPAVARDRQGRAERAARGPADGVADRHQVRVAGLRPAAASGGEAESPRCPCGAPRAHLRSRSCRTRADAEGDGRPAGRALGAMPGGPSPTWSGSLDRPGGRRRGCRRLGAGTRRVRPSATPGASGRAAPGRARARACARVVAQGEVGRLRTD